MMRGLLSIISIVFAVATALPVNTTRRNLSTAGARQREVAVIADSVCAEAPYDFEPNAVTLRGFVKRAGDYRETFHVTNNTRRHITGLKLLFRYTDLRGRVIAERTVVVRCDVMPGLTQKVSVPSFDTDRAYHYRYGSKPRLKSQPFDVAFRLLRYDVAVER
ncbi:MAG: hypothetical protein ACI4AN_01260 [Muribaculaceae bacterium]